MNKILEHEKNTESEAADLIKAIYSVNNDDYVNVQKKILEPRLVRIWDAYSDEIQDTKEKIGSLIKKLVRSETQDYENNENKKELPKLPESANPFSVQLICEFLKIWDDSFTSLEEILKKNNQEQEVKEIKNWL
jgi:hypothetical protein